VKRVVGLTGGLASGKSTVGRWLAEAGFTVVDADRVVAGLITGRIKVALSIGLVELFTKLCLYYLHERVWNRIPFGKVKVREDYEI